MYENQTMACVQAGTVPPVSERLEQRIATLERELNELKGARDLLKSSPDAMALWDAMSKIRNFL